MSDTITDTVISFGYLGNEVPTGEELWLKIYHLEDRCVGDASDIDCWTPLETALDMAQNQASAKVDGPGIYAMFSTVEIVLEDGWNLIGYPVQGTRLVTEVWAPSLVTIRWSTVSTRMIQKIPGTSTFPVRNLGQVTWRP